MLLKTVILFCFLRLGFLQSISFRPSPVLLHEQETVNVTLSIEGNGTSEVDLNLHSKDNEIALVTDLTNVGDGNYTVTIFGKRFGRTEVNDKNLTCESLQVAVLRVEHSAVTTMFNVMIGVIIIVNTFIIGTQLELDIVKKVAHKPSAVIIGLVCQFILMPLLAFSWGTVLLGSAGDLLLSFFVVGCVPCGGSANKWTILLDGSLDNSIAITFCSFVLSSGFMPLWLLTLGQNVIARHATIKIPFVNIMIPLAGLIIPSFLGLIVRKYRPAWTDFFRKIIKESTLISMILVAIFGGYAVRFVIRFLNVPIMLCGILLPLSGFLIGAFVALLLRQPLPDIKSISIATGVQNAGIALSVLRFSLPQPEADLATVLPVVVVASTPIPIAALFICLNIKGWINSIRSWSRKRVENRKRSISKFETASENEGGNSEALLNTA